MLEGVRWKYYHYAMGPTLQDLPDISWKYVLEEKSPDMIHVLQFPYNGEPPRDRLVQVRSVGLGMQPGHVSNIE